MASLTSPSAIREILAQHGIRLKKSLGQHFLADANVLERVLEAIEPKATETAVEVGAGIGTLTVALAPKVKKLFAVEIDPRLIPILREQTQGLANVQVLATDFLDVPLRDLGDELLLVGNLPYAITSEVLLKLIREREVVRRAVFTVQWEVGEKLVAPPGPKVNRLGVHLRAYFQVELLRKISRTVFFPPPEVDGALVRILRLPRPRIAAAEEIFERTLALVFGHRRKTLRQALASHFPPELVDEILGGLGLDPRVRGEALDLEDWDRLSLKLSPYLSVAQNLSPR